MLTVRDIGVGAVRLAPFLESTARWIYSRLPHSWHDTPTSWLESQFRTVPDIAFIQIGAFDGIAGDPIRPLILGHPSWKGALVEPQTVAFAQLQDNYASAASRLRFFNCAVSDTSGTIEIYQIEEREIERLSLPPWSREVASISETHIKKHFPDARISTRTVSTMRVSDIARACNFTRVDLLVMDVEGHERRIIDDVDFGLLGVRAVVFEHKHMTRQDREAVFDRLMFFGFKTRRYGRDTVAYRYQ